jgi:hypothetical protein
MTGPTSPIYTKHRLEKLRFAIEQRLGASVAASIDVEQVADHMARDIVFNVAGLLLVERLPPQRLEHRLEAEHPEAGGTDGYTEDPRWATWRDHFWASHRRLRRLFRRTPRTVMTIVRYRVAVPVKCRHDVTLNIEDKWTYPYANTIVPGMGMAVLKSAPSLLGPLSEAVSPYDD